MKEPLEREDDPPAQRPRQPYEPPRIESEPIVERQLLVTCVTFELGCDQDPPQS